MASGEMELILLDYATKNPMVLGSRSEPLDNRAGVSHRAGGHAPGRRAARCALPIPRL
jgi:hypothetical protein